MPRHAEQPSGKGAPTTNAGISLNDLVDVTTSAQGKRLPARRKQATPASGITVGKLAGFSESGQPLVNVAGSGGLRPHAARSAVELRERDAGSDVVLVFERENVRKPIILGVLRDTGHHTAEHAVEAKLDGETVFLTAGKEIVLRCGKASITLTRAGKVLIRGEYLLSRSAGVNRIKGGSVQIN